MSPMLLEHYITKTLLPNWVTWSVGATYADALHLSSELAKGDPKLE